MARDANNFQDLTSYVSSTGRPIQFW